MGSGHGEVLEGGAVKTLKLKRPVAREKKFTAWAHDGARAYRNHVIRMTKLYADEQVLDRRLGRVIPVWRSRS